MSKRILLILLGLALIAAGCANDEYAVEKRYWQAQKQAGKIFKNPNASPPKELERVVKILGKFSLKYPNSNLAIDADFNIARLYIVKEAYDKARTQLRTILNKYRTLEAACAEALFLTGNSYQIEDKWNLALQQYRKIMQEYPTTPKGLDIPIYIAQFYKIKYQPEKMLAAYEEAISHYKTLAAKHPDLPLAYIADMLTAQCYLALKDWQSAIANFQAILEKYKGKAGDLDSVLLNLALIYKQQLKDEIKAKEFLERLLKEYPKSRLVNSATNLLKELDRK